jgi:hypothetical protein
MLTVNHYCNTFFYTSKFTINLMTNSYLLFNNALIFKQNKILKTCENIDIHFIQTVEVVLL